MRSTHFAAAPEETKTLHVRQHALCRRVDCLDGSARGGVPDEDGVQRQTSRGMGAVARRGGATSRAGVTFGSGAGLASLSLGNKQQGRNGGRRGQRRSFYLRTGQSALKSSEIRLSLPNLQFASVSTRTTVVYCSIII